MDKYSREIMLGLTSNEYKKAIAKYLLSFDQENWKIFVDNFYKLTSFEAERILIELTAKLDIHMIMDLLTLSQIIGQSITLSNALIQSFTRVNISEIEEQFSNKVNALLDSYYAEERRIGLLLAGYFDRSEFFDKIERMSDYDILFEDAYFALGLMSDSKIIELLSTKFMVKGKNLVQRNAIAKILAQKGNPLAALWIFKSKGFDEELSPTKSIYLSREIAWAGVYPHLFFNSNDDLLQPMTMKMINGLAAILPYDIDLITEIKLLAIVEELLKAVEEKSNIDLIGTIIAFKYTINDLYFNLDPFTITTETRNQITKSWKLLEKFPGKETLSFVKKYITENFSIENQKELTNSLKLIKIFKLNEFERHLLELSKINDFPKQMENDLISALGAICSYSAARVIREKILQKVDYSKRTNLSDQISQFHSDIDYYDDFNNDEIRMINQTFGYDISFWGENDSEDYFYWNALYCLSLIKQDENLPIFIQAIQDYDPKIRLEAIIAIKQTDILTPQIEENLLSMIDNEKFLSIQREAILTLGKLNSHKAISKFISIVSDALTDGTLTFINNLIEEYDDRWEEDEDDSPADSSESKAEEIGAIPQFGDKFGSQHRKFREEDIERWSKRLSKNNSFNLELREDLNNEELDLTLESEVIDEYSPVSGYEIDEEFETSDDVQPLTKSDEEIDDNDDWMKEIGEKFKKLTIVESALEALKTTKAPIPLNQIKEIINQPVDEELYKDALIILARRNDHFAINELIGLFELSDYLRAREIINTLIEINYNKLDKITAKIRESPDWIIKATLKNNES